MFSLADRPLEKAFLDSGKLDLQSSTKVLIHLSKTNTFYRRPSVISKNIFFVDIQLPFSPFSMLQYAPWTLLPGYNIEKGRGGRNAKIRDWKIHAFNETGPFRGASQLLLSMIVGFCLFFFFGSLPPTQSSFVFCAGVQFSRDFIRAFNNRIERFSFDCRKVIGCFTLSTPHDWLKSFAPLFHPTRNTTKTNRDAYARVSPRFATATIGSLDCLCPLWLARVITLVLVLRHSSENHSKNMRKLRAVNSLLLEVR